jgi:hypothetical protein
MQLAYAANAIHSNIALDSSQAKIRASAHMLRVLSSGLYQNKIRALLREIGANAADAHLMIGRPDLPVEVHLPSKAHPTFWIRDRGPGMTHEFVMENYQTYGDSDKRIAIVTDGMSDAETAAAKEYAKNATGGFGLGSKCPYAYSDQFTVEVAQAGKLRRYACYIRPDGMFQTDEVEVRDASDDWPHGVRVSVPVRTQDIDKFVTEARHVYRWFRTRPTILNAKVEFPEEGLKTPLVTFYTLGDQDTYEHTDLYVRMGDCAYPVTLAGLGSTFVEGLKSEITKDLLGWYCSIQAPMGSFDIAPSREAPDYTPRTLDTLRKLLKQASLEIAEHIATTFNTNQISWDNLQPKRDQVRANDSFRNYIRPALLQRGTSSGQATLVHSALTRPVLELTKELFTEQGWQGHIWWYREHADRNGKSWRRSLVQPNPARSNTVDALSLSTADTNAVVVVGNPPRVDQRIRAALANGDYRQVIHVTPYAVTQDVTNPVAKEVLSQQRKDAKIAANDAARSVAKTLFGLPVVDASTLPEVAAGSRTAGPKTKYPKAACGIYSIDAAGADCTWETTADAEDTTLYALYADYGRRRRTPHRSYMLQPGGASMSWWTAERVWRAVAQRMADAQDGTEIKFFVLAQPVIDRYKLLQKYSFTPVHQTILDWFDPIGKELEQLEIKDSSAAVFLAEKAKYLADENPYGIDSLLAHAYDDTAWWQHVSMHVTAKKFTAALNKAADQMRKLTGDIAAATNIPDDLGEMRELAGWLGNDDNNKPRWKLPSATVSNRWAAVKAALLIGLNQNTTGSYWHQQLMQRLANAGNCDLFPLKDPDLCTHVINRIFK